MKCRFSASLFKNTISILKSLYNEANIVFYDHYIEISIIDTSQNAAFVVTLLPLDPMEGDKDMIWYGVNLQQLYQFVRTIKKNDVIIFESSSTSKEYLNISIESNGLTNKLYSINNSIIPVVFVVIPWTSVKTEIEMSTHHLQNIITSIRSFSSSVTITYRGNDDIEFHTSNLQGNTIKQYVSKDNDTEYSIISKNDDMTIQLFSYEYDIYYIDRLLKKVLCDIVKVGFLEDGSMLISQQDKDKGISSIVLLLSPKNQDTTST